jgi:hypothetical protein
MLGATPSPELYAYLQRLEDVAAHGEALLVDAVAVAVDLSLAEEFNTQSDPSGSPWKPRKQPTGSWPLLRKTGVMARSSRIVKGRNYVDVSVEEPADYHQGGTSRMVARRILPGGGAASRWTRRMDDLARAKLISMLKVGA